jgi:predicted helicase
MVQKVGDRRYWEQWAADVAKIAQGYIERINRLIAKEGKHKTEFDAFLSGLRKNINPSVEPGEVVEPEIPKNVTMFPMSTQKLR